MSLVNHTIPGFFNGMSQQPPAIRLDTQCENEVNGWSSLVDGMVKRPPTKHVVTLTSNVSNNSFVHTINRDSSERYSCIFTGDSTEPIEVFTQSGVKCSMRYGKLLDDLSFTADDSVKNYVTSFGSKVPATSLRAVTVADSTMIVNNTMTCAMSDTVDGAIKKQAIVYVNKGVAETTYQLILNGVVISAYTTDVSTNYSSYRADVIMQNLQTNWAAASAAKFYGDGVTRTFLASGPVNIVVYLNGTLKTAGVDYTVSGNTVTFTNYTPQAGAEAIYTTDEYGNSTLVTPGHGPDEILINSSASTPYTFTRKGSTMIVTRTDGNDFTLKAYDTWGEQALSVIKNATQSFDDLPPTAFDAFTVEILGDPNSDSDNYWVRYTEMGNTGNWQECVKPGLKNQFNTATLPHKLVRTNIINGVPEFTFSPIVWEPRKVGDETTASEPSFIGNTINDIFFYRNRLGLLSSENIILSKASDFFNFWIGSAMTVLDDDPIDIAASTNEVCILYHAEPFNNSLLVLSDQTQFILQSGTNALTPKTAALDISTKFPTSPSCRPTSAGSNVYFVAPKTNNSTIKEYFVQNTTLTNDAADVAAHVPRLLPIEVQKLIGNSNIDTVFAFSPVTPSNVYVYRYYWNGDQKAQSSWSVWEFDGDIVDIALIDTTFVMVVKRGTQVSLEVITLEKEYTGDLPFKVHLDRLCEVTGVYSDGITTWTLPYQDTASVDAFNIVSGSDGNRIYNISKPSNTTLTALGDYSGTSCFIGKTYDHRYQFSEWFLKAPNSNVGTLSGRLQMRTLTLNYTNTGYFRVIVTPKGRDPYIHEFAGAVLGFSKLGSPSIISETRRFPVMANAQGTKLEIVNDSYLPSEFHSATLEGTYTDRSTPV